MPRLVERIESAPPRERAARGETFRVVFVCTGNRARSPLAKALLRRRLSDLLSVDVSSAGTLRLDGAPALPAAVRAARRLGIDLAEHRSRALGSGSLASADLVLGFELFHLETAVAAGARPERSFLLSELVALLPPDGGAGDPVRRARTAVRRAHARRLGSGAPGATAIGDPVGRPESTMRQTALEIDALVSRLALALFDRAGAGAGAAGS